MSLESQGRLRRGPDQGAVTTIMVTRVGLGAGYRSREGGGGGGGPLVGGAGGRDVDGEGRGRVGPVHGDH